MHHADVLQTATGLIIADDLTGSCDTGVQFATPGRPATVLIAGDLPFARSGLHAGRSHGSALPVAAPLIVDTESRHVPVSTAADRVRAVARAFAGESDRGLIFKKIDSTLRGNIGAEVGSLAAALPGRIVIVAPAYPASGRTTVEGRCYVGGVPVDRTEFAHDRLSPVRSSLIADLFSDEPATETTHATPASLRDAIVDAKEGARLIVDASTEADLALISATVQPLLQRLILVGSAGFANAIAGVYGPAGHGRSPSVSPGGSQTDAATPGSVQGPFSSAHPVVAIVGSLSERSRAQAGVLSAREEVQAVELDSAGIGAAEAPGLPVDRGVDAVLDALADGRDVLVVTARPTGSRRPASAGRVAAACGELARRVVEREPEVGLFLTGGDTSLAVVRALGSRELRVYREVAPGVPAIGIVAGRREVRAVTKAGGFGDDEVMVQARDCLREGLCWQ